MAQKYTGRQRSYSTFAADVEDWVKESDENLLKVMRASINDVVENAQQPVARGGRMRVDTGFLRNSGQGNLGSMPSGPDVKPATAVRGQYVWENNGLIATLAKMKVGDTFYWGWTANYARYRELYDGFMEAALQHWGRIVAFNADALKRRKK